MCGIAGMVSLCQPVSREELQAMSDALTHRGPDASGMQIIDHPVHVGLAHRRLRIIDLSDAAVQPMCNEDQSVWVCYNGEFYNFADYRAELIAKGHVFKSESDTETIVHLYEEYGIEETLQRMNGMFAFALWDQNRGKLFLARDRMGQKPLYFREQDDLLTFASEMKAIKNGAEINQAALSDFWRFGYVPGPHTVLDGVRQLPPAHYLTWENGNTTMTEYWTCKMGHEQPVDASLEELTDELEALLLDAIRLRLISDVPLGLFLSGGIDSNVICALANKLATGSLDTYTIAFASDAHNEADHAAAVAQHLGLRNRTFTVDEQLSDAFPMIAQQFDQPFGDFSAIPTYFVCKKTREHATVALSGDGGDELFGGYNHYFDALQLFAGKRLGRSFTLREKMAAVFKRGSSPSMAFANWARLLQDKHLERILLDPVTREMDAKVGVAQGMNGNALAGMQAIDIATYLPDDILCKVDRMSMAVSLECRSPFLDYRVVEFAAKLPYEAKIDPQGGGKRILRELLSRYLPADLYERPKSGFTPPWERWCAGPIRDELVAGWDILPETLFQSDALNFLAPEDGSANPLLSWCAYSCVQFFQSLDT